MTNLDTSYNYKNKIVGELDQLRFDVQDYTKESGHQGYSQVKRSRNVTTSLY